jgi:hypothetical protein
VRIVRQIAFMRSWDIQFLWRTVLRVRIIRKVLSYCRLSRPERRLAMRSIFLVTLVRLGVWLIPFRTIQRVCAYFGRTGRSGRRSAAGTREIVWAVRLASRYVPRATCLVQALAAQILLGRNGRDGQVHIGVALDEKQGFRAHAWVESGGEVLIGGSEELDGYAPMLVLDGSTRQSAGSLRG